jgi:hypothetical protein
MESKQFHLGDVLSITTGILMSPRKMDGVYDILNFMTQDNLFTHQLPRASQECAPFLLEQHPQLKGIVIEGVTTENFKQRLEDLCAEHGETLMVNQLPKNAHEVIDPESELAEKVHPSKIIKIKM